MDDNEYAYNSVYEGTVVDNRDPKLLGRIRAVIPGLVEPQTAWALPYGMPGSGSNARGLWFIPKVGANVAIVFKEGDVETPRYLCGPWGAPGQQPESPTFVRDMRPSEAVEVAGIQTEKWNIVLDDRDGVDRLTIENRAFPENSITLDGTAQAIQIKGTVAVQIQSTGIVTIEALSIVLNGRPVLPGSSPI